MYKEYPKIVSAVPETKPFQSFLCLPDGFYKLTVPLKCCSGLFEAGDTIYLETSLWGAASARAYGYSEGNFVSEFILESEFNDIDKSCFIPDEAKTKRYKKLHFFEALFLWDLGFAPAVLLAPLLLIISICLNIACVMGVFVISWLVVVANKHFNEKDIIFDCLRKAQKEEAGEVKGQAL